MWCEISKRRPAKDSSFRPSRWLEWAIPARCCRLMSVLVARVYHGGIDRPRSSCGWIFRSFRD
eukprot:9490650-Pyramimonas_sp.AAC.1